MAVFFDLKSLPNCPLRLKNLLILAICFMHHFPCSKFYLGLPFSPPGLAWLPFLFPKVQFGNQQKTRWGGRLARHLGAPGAPRIFAPLLCSLPPWRELNLSRHSLPPENRLPFLHKRLLPFQVILAVVDQPPQSLDALEGLRTERQGVGQEPQLLLHHRDADGRIPGNLPGQVVGEVLQLCRRYQVVEQAGLEGPRRRHRQSGNKHLPGQGQADHIHDMQHAGGIVRPPPVAPG